MYEGNWVTGSSRISDIPQVFVDSTNSGESLIGCIPREPCEWTPEISRLLLSYFAKCDKPFRFERNIPFQEPLRSEIRRFFISLDAYIDSPHPVIPYRDILYGSTNKDYAKTLKRIKRKSFETSWSANEFAYPDWWNEVPSYLIEDIGDIFNYSYLIFWQEDVEDDYLNGLIPVNQDPDVLQEFRAAVYNVLPEREIEIIAKEEVLAQLSGSQALDSRTLKRKPHYLLKRQHLRFSRERGLALRTVIPVSPANTRDSIEVSPSDLNTISLLDRQVMEVLRHMKGHIHLTNKDEATKRIRKLNRKYSWFLQRDIKKEGITKPMTLLKIMLEVLHESYPDIEIFSYTTFFDNYTLITDDGVRIAMKRGHGLGMANALTTLMQIAIHNMVMQRLSDQYGGIECDALAINDDFMAGFHILDEMENYWDEEDEVMAGLSVLREPNKSFYTHFHSVIAERYCYNGEEAPKVSYQLRELLYPLTCYNIVMAKEYFIAAQVYCNVKYTAKYIGEIRNYWGHEFFHDEFRYPSLCGGWINESINGVDMSLVLLDKLPFSEKVCRGFKASSASYKFYPKDGKLLSPFQIIYGNPRFPDKYDDHFDFLSESELDFKYGRKLQRDSKFFRYYWDILKTKRANLFNEQYKLTFKQFIDEAVKAFPIKQFYPIEQMIDHYAQGDVYGGTIRDYYLDPNPRVACLAKYNTTTYPFKEEFSINFVNPDATTKKVNSIFSKEIARSLKSEIIASEITGPFHEIYVPRDESPENIYINPINIGYVTALKDWGYGYPIIKEKYKSPIIELKKEVFGTLFSVDEMIAISEINPKRSLLKELVDYMGPQYRDLVVIGLQELADDAEAAAILKERYDRDILEYGLDADEPYVETFDEATGYLKIELKDFMHEDLQVLWNHAVGTRVVFGEPELLTSQAWSFCVQLRGKIEAVNMGLINTMTTATFERDIKALLGPVYRTLIGLVKLVQDFDSILSGANLASDETDEPMGLFGDDF